MDILSVAISSAQGLFDIKRPAVTLIVGNSHATTTDAHIGERSGDFNWPDEALVLQLPQLMSPSSVVVEVQLWETEGSMRTMVGTSDFSLAHLLDAARSFKASATTGDPEGCWFGIADEDDDMGVGFVRILATIASVSTHSTQTNTLQAPLTYPTSKRQGGIGKTIGGGDDTVAEDQELSSQAPGGRFVPTTEKLPLDEKSPPNRHHESSRSPANQPLESHTRDRLASSVQRKSSKSAPPHANFATATHANNEARALHGDLRVRVAGAVFRVNTSLQAPFTQPHGLANRPYVRLSLGPQAQACMVATPPAALGATLAAEKRSTPGDKLECPSRERRQMRGRGLRALLSVLSPPMRCVLAVERSNREAQLGVLPTVSDAHADFVRSERRRQEQSQQWWEQHLPGGAAGDRDADGNGRDADEDKAKDDLESVDEVEDEEKDSPSATFTVDLEEGVGGVGDSLAGLPKARQFLVSVGFVSAATSSRGGDYLSFSSTSSSVSSSSLPSTSSRRRGNVFELLGSHIQRDRNVRRRIKHSFWSIARLLDLHGMDGDDDYDVDTNVGGGGEGSEGWVVAGMEWAVSPPLVLPVTSDQFLAGTPPSPSAPSLACLGGCAPVLHIEALTLGSAPAPSLSHGSTSSSSLGSCVLSLDALMNPDPPSDWLATASAAHAGDFSEMRCFVWHRIVRLEKAILLLEIRTDLRVPSSRIPPTPATTQFLSTPHRSFDKRKGAKDPREVTSHHLSAHKHSVHRERRVVEARRFEADQRRCRALPRHAPAPRTCDALAVLPLRLKLTGPMHRLVNTVRNGNVNSTTGGGRVQQQQRRPHLWLGARTLGGGGSLPSSSHLLSSTSFGHSERVEIDAACIPSPQAAASFNDDGTFETDLCPRDDDGSASAEAPRLILRRVSDCALAILEITFRLTTAGSDSTSGGCGGGEEDVVIAVATVSLAAALTRAREAATKAKKKQRRKDPAGARSGSSDDDDVDDGGVWVALSLPRTLATEEEAPPVCAWVRLRVTLRAPPLPRTPLSWEGLPTLDESEGGGHTFALGSRASTSSLTARGSAAWRGTVFAAGGLLNAIVDRGRGGAGGGARSWSKGQGRQKGRAATRAAAHAAALAAAAEGYDSAMEPQDGKLFAKLLKQRHKQSHHRQLQRHRNKWGDEDSGHNGGSYSSSSSSGSVGLTIGSRCFARGPPPVILLSEATSVARRSGGERNGFAVAWHTSPVPMAHRQGGRGALFITLRAASAVDASPAKVQPVAVQLEMSVDGAALQNNSSSSSSSSNNIISKKGGSSSSVVWHRIGCARWPSKGKSGSSGSSGSSVDDNDLTIVFGAFRFLLNWSPRRPIVPLLRLTPLFADPANNGLDTTSSGQAVVLSAAAAFGMPCQPLHLAVALKQSTPPCGKAVGDTRDGSRDDEVVLGASLCFVPLEGRTLPPSPHPVPLTPRPPSQSCVRVRLAGICLRRLRLPEGAVQALAAHATSGGSGGSMSWGLQVEARILTGALSSTAKMNSGEISDSERRKSNDGGGGFVFAGVVNLTRLPSPSPLSFVGGCAKATPQSSATGQVSTDGRGGGEWMGGPLCFDLPPMPSGSSGNSLSACTTPMLELRLLLVDPSAAPTGSPSSSSSPPSLGTRSCCVGLAWVALPESLLVGGEPLDSWVPFADPGTSSSFSSARGGKCCDGRVGLHAWQGGGHQHEEEAAREASKDTEHAPCNTLALPSSASMPPSKDSSAWFLRVEVIAARALRSASLPGTTHPFVTLHVHNSQSDHGQEGASAHGRRTGVATSGGDAFPVWGSTVYVPLNCNPSSPPPSSMVVLIASVLSAAVPQSDAGAFMCHAAVEVPSFVFLTNEHGSSNGGVGGASGGSLSYRSWHALRGPLTAPLHSNSLCGELCLSIRAVRQPPSAVAPFVSPLPVSSQLLFSMSPNPRLLSLTLPPASSSSATAGGAMKGTNRTPAVTHSRSTARGDAAGGGGEDTKMGRLCTLQLVDNGCPPRTSNQGKGVCVLQVRASSSSSKNAKRAFPDVLCLSVKSGHPNTQPFATVHVPLATTSKANESSAGASLVLMPFAAATTNTSSQPTTVQPELGLVFETVSRGHFIKEIQRRERAEGDCSIPSENPDGDLGGIEEQEAVVVWVGELGLATARSLPGCPVETTLVLRPKLIPEQQPPLSAAPTAATQPEEPASVVEDSTPNKTSRLDSRRHANLSPAVPRPFLRLSAVVTWLPLESLRGTLRLSLLTLTLSREREVAWSLLGAHPERRLRFRARSLVGSALAFSQRSHRITRQDSSSGSTRAVRGVRRGCELPRTVDLDGDEILLRLDADQELRPCTLATPQTTTKRNPSRKAGVAGVLDEISDDEDFDDDDDDNGKAVENGDHVVANDDEVERHRVGSDGGVCALPLVELALLDDRRCAHNFLGLADLDLLPFLSAAADACVGKALPAPPRAVVFELPILTANHSSSAGSGGDSAGGAPGSGAVLGTLALCVRFEPSRECVEALRRAATTRRDHTTGEVSGGLETTNLAAPSDSMSHSARLSSRPREAAEVADALVKTTEEALSKEGEATMRVVDWQLRLAFMNAATHTSHQIHRSFVAASTPHPHRQKGDTAESRQLSHAAPSPPSSLPAGVASKVSAAEEKWASVDDLRTALTTLLPLLARKVETKTEEGVENHGFSLLSASQVTYGSANAALDSFPSSSASSLLDASFAYPATSTTPAPPESSPSAVLIAAVGTLLPMIVQTFDALATPVPTDRRAQPSGDTNMGNLGSDNGSVNKTVRTAPTTTMTKMVPFLDYSAAVTVGLAHLAQMTSTRVKESRQSVQNSNAEWAILKQRHLHPERISRLASFSRAIVARSYWAPPPHTTTAAASTQRRSLVSELRTLQKPRDTSPPSDRKAASHALVGSDSVRRRLDGDGGSDRNGDHGNLLLLAEPFSSSSSAPRLSNTDVAGRSVVTFVDPLPSVSSFPLTHSGSQQLVAVSSPPRSAQSQASTRNASGGGGGSDAFAGEEVRRLQDEVKYLQTHFDTLSQERLSATAAAAEGRRESGGLRQRLRAEHDDKEQAQRTVRTAQEELENAKRKVGASQGQEAERAVRVAVRALLVAPEVKALAAAQRMREARHASEVRAVVSIQSLVRGATHRRALAQKGCAASVVASAVRRWRGRSDAKAQQALRVEAAGAVQRVARGILSRQRVGTLMALLPKLQAVVRGRSLRKRNVLREKRVAVEAAAATERDREARKVVMEARAERELRMKRGQEKAAALAERSLMACAEAEGRFVVSRDEYVAAAEKEKSQLEASRATEQARVVQAREEVAALEVEAAQARVMVAHAQGTELKAKACAEQARKAETEAGAGAVKAGRAAEEAKTASKEAGIELEQKTAAVALAADELSSWSMKRAVATRQAEAEVKANEALLTRQAELLQQQQEQLRLNNEQQALALRLAQNGHTPSTTGTHPNRYEELATLVPSPAVSSPASTSTDSTPLAGRAPSLTTVSEHVPTEKEEPCKADLSSQKSRGEVKGGQASSKEESPRAKVSTVAPLPSAHALRSGGGDGASSASPGADANKNKGARRWGRSKSGNVCGSGGALSKSNPLEPAPASPIPTAAAHAFVPTSEETVSTSPDNVQSTSGALGECSDGAGSAPSTTNPSLLADAAEVLLPKDEREECAAAIGPTKECSDLLQAAEISRKDYPDPNCSEDTADMPTDSQQDHAKDSGIEDGNDDGKAVTCANGDVLGSYAHEQGEVESARGDDVSNANRVTEVLFTPAQEEDGDSCNVQELSRDSVKVLDEQRGLSVVDDGGDDVDVGGATLKSVDDANSDGSEIQVLAVDFSPLPSLGREMQVESMQNVSAVNNEEKETVPIVCKDDDESGDNENDDGDEDGCDRVEDDDDGACAEGPMVEVGAFVECRYKTSNKWYAATVSSVAIEPGSASSLSPASAQSGVVWYGVRYEDGECEEMVRRLRLRRIGEVQRLLLCPGERVDARCPLPAPSLTGGPALAVLPARIVETASAPSRSVPTTASGEDGNSNDSLSTLGAADSSYYVVRFDSKSVAAFVKNNGGKAGGWPSLASHEETISRRHIFALFHPPAAVKE